MLNDLRERGRKGGTTTLAKYGAKHFSELAKSKKGMKYKLKEREQDVKRDVQKLQS